MSQVNKAYTIKEVVKNGKKYYLRFEEIDEDYLVNEIFSKFCMGK